MIRGTYGDFGTKSARIVNKRGKRTQNRSDFEQKNGRKRKKKKENAILLSARLPPRSSESPGALAFANAGAAAPALVAACLIWQPFRMPGLQRRHWWLLALFGHPCELRMPGLQRRHWWLLVYMRDAISQVRGGHHATRRSWEIEGIEGIRFLHCC